MECRNIRDDKECGGVLTKLKNYYVCTDCCSDIITFKEVVELTREERGAYGRLPGEPSIEILHPEMSGYYTYNISFQTEYFTHYSMYGKNNRLMGALHMEDYSNAKWMINYKGPANVFFYHTNGYSTGKTLETGEIKFYPIKPTYKKEKSKKK